MNKRPYPHRGARSLSDQEATSYAVSDLEYSPRIRALSLTKHEQRSAHPMCVKSCICMQCISRQLDPLNTPYLA